MRNILSKVLSFQQERHASSSATTIEESMIEMVKSRLSLREWRRRLNLALGSMLQWNMEHCYSPSVIIHDSRLVRRLLHLLIDGRTEKGVTGKEILLKRAKES